MITAGIEVISAGANVPFADPQIFFGPIADKADNNLSVIPDFISNCGMARVFAYLMSNDLDELTDEGIFSDTSNIIRKALENAHSINSSKKGIAKTSFEFRPKSTCINHLNQAKNGSFYSYCICPRLSSHHA